MEYLTINEQIVNESISAPLTSPHQYNRGCTWEYGQNFDVRVT